MIRIKKPKDQPSEKQTKVILPSDDPRTPEKWTGLDMTNIGLHMLSPQLFQMKFLTFMYLNNNNLAFIPAEISHLENLELIDLSHNKLHSVPAEMGKLRKLKELLLFHNNLNILPFELGALFQIHTLGLHGNPLNEPLRTYHLEGTETVMNYLLDNTPIAIAPPEREWVELKTRKKPIPADADGFSCFCYNILCDKYATRALYGYCPSWALDWEYRKSQILREINNFNSDIVLLQEVETNEYNVFFEPKLKENGYAGVFRAKSRARTMGESAKKEVDGCAVFYKTAKYDLVKDELVEFERLGAQYGAGSTDMLNRVMPKDNIAILMLLEDKVTKASMFVGNAHLTWDPEFKDVKVIQTAMLTSEMSKFMAANIEDEVKRKQCAILMGGDFNSTPDSGVVEFMSKGKISQKHPDLETRDYNKFADKVGLTHNLNLKSVYTGQMPYTNYTHDFTGIIDYLFYSADHIAPTKLLGPINAKSMQNFDGCPNPHFASDHFSLAAELKFLTAPQKTG
eukprot:m.131422 g.131422  ORF g.131422 m.131422 type:complete len:511 (-) comp29546_c0_seq1:160-1692(-)